MKYLIATIALCISCLVSAGHHEKGEMSVNITATKAAYESPRVCRRQFYLSHATLLDSVC